MYAGVENESNCAVDIPEWKKLLIMKKRAAASEEQTRSCVRNSNLSNGDANANPAKSGDKYIIGGRGMMNNDHENDGRSVRNSLEATPPKIVTRKIGSINVELRSVPQDSYSPDGSKLSDSYHRSKETDSGDDMQYGPGIVDRLRAKFLNMGIKKQPKPVVRRFSSLENLPATNAGQYRLSASKMFRQNGMKASGNHHNSVKKAQSMETLLSVEQQIIVANKRPSARFSGAKARILAKNVSPIPVLTDENDEPGEKTPSPILSPKHEQSYPKLGKRWDFNRSTSAPSIKENELPKPDTVKQFKKIFESPPYNPEKSNVVCTRFRKLSNQSPTINPPIFSQCNGAIPGETVFQTKEDIKPLIDISPEDVQPIHDANNRLPEIAKPIVDTKDVEPLIFSAEDVTPQDDHSPFDEVYSPIHDIAHRDQDDIKTCIGDIDYSHDDEDVVDYRFNEDVSHHIDDEDDVDDETPDAKCCNGAKEEPSDDETTREDLSPNERTLPTADDDNNTRVIEREESQESFIESVKVTDERLPFLGASEETEELQESQVSRELESDEAEHTPSPAADDITDPGYDGLMVVASGTNGSAPDFTKPWKAKKAPQATTSVVFDFRGKDVKPNISLNPTPFGCKPAKTPRGPRRAGSPPRGSADPFVNGVDSGDYYGGYVDGEEDDWDEMDIGADLPAESGIVFAGENVKVGRGALLETRNKKLTIQFDDTATATFEYPSETTTPSPTEENGLCSLTDPVSTLKSSLAISSPANSRTGLTNYTPHGLSSSEDFQLGVSRPVYRHPSLTPKSEFVDPVPMTDEIVPANPEDTAGWSAAETADILF